jgi:hypothetical protein
VKFQGRGTDDCWQFLELGKNRKPNAALQEWRCAEISFFKERRSRGDGGRARSAHARCSRALARPVVHTKGSNAGLQAAASTTDRASWRGARRGQPVAGSGSTAAKFFSPAVMPGNTVPFASVSIRAAATICRGMGRQQAHAGGVALRGPLGARHRQQPVVQSGKGNATPCDAGSGRNRWLFLEFLLRKVIRIAGCVNPKRWAHDDGHHHTSMS